MGNNNRPQQNQGNQRPFLVSNGVKQCRLTCALGDCEHKIAEKEKEGWIFYSSISIGGSEIILFFQK